VKTKSFRLGAALIRLFALPSVLFLCQNLLAAVTFTNTPSAVSNTYNGTITLQIGGLTNTEKVVVQKFLDLNTNGVIDGNDWLVQQFTLQDGTNFVIGGVTNFNVPGDLNATTGAITATLNFQNGDFVQNIVGEYLFKLSSPVGHFAPLTNQFAVTNFPLPQKFTGNVVSNSTSTTLSNAIVLLFPPPLPAENGPSGGPLAGVVANKAGSYTIPAPAGTYLLAAFRSNYLANFAAAPVVTLGASQTVTTNLTLTNATSSIAGKFVDASNQAVGLPGVMVSAMSTNNLLAIAFTDTNGNFNIPVTAGTWSVKMDDRGLVLGYLRLYNKTNVAAGTTGVTLAFPKATSLIYGSVKDNLGNPFVALDVYSDDHAGSGQYETDGYTDTNGNYVVGVLGVGTADSWYVVANDAGQITNYVFSEPAIDQNGGTNISAGQAVQANITGILATNTIRGNVKCSGTNIVGVGVWASATINGLFYETLGNNTDTNGNYSINVANGTWNVEVNCGGFGGTLDGILGSGTYACPSSQTAVINNNNATNNFTVQLCGGICIVTPSPLPVGEVNVPYDQFLQASSCNGNFTWLQTGGTLPGNLNLSTNGQFYELSGTPNSSGVFTFTVQVTDGDSLTTNKQLSVTISNAVQITTTSLPNGTNGLNYSQQLQAAAGVPFGGASPYSWSLASGSLPANLTLATNGLLSGTLATSGLFNFTVQATDLLTATNEQSLSLTIISTNTYPPLTVGLGGGQVIVLWPASAGTNYTLQMTTNLAAGPWVPATNGVPAVAFTFTNNLPAAFFRLQ
jgi:hypothetical protein